MKIELIASERIDEDKWNDFISRSPQGSPYTLYQTLSILLPGWKAIVVEQDGEWEAVFPFPRKKKYGISYCFQLPWTQHSGILLAPYELKNAQYLEKVKKIINGILDIATKKCLAFDLALSPEFDYVLPFLWKGFEITPKFTYQLNLTQEQEIEDNFSSSTRKKIRKAEKCDYVIRPLQNVSELIRIYRKEVGDRLSHLKHENYVQLENLIRFLLKNDQAAAFEAWSGNEFAGGLVLYLDKRTAYFPLGITMESHRSSGLMSLLLKESMIHVKERGCEVFDFEGSSIEDIERFFRGFGALPVTYMNISKFPKWLKLIRQK